MAPNTKDSPTLKGFVGISFLRANILKGLGSFSGFGEIWIASFDPRQVAYVPYLPSEMATAWLLMLGFNIKAACLGLFIQDLHKALGDWLPLPPTTHSPPLGSLLTSAWNNRLARNIRLEWALQPCHNS